MEELSKLATFKMRKWGLSDPYTQFPITYYLQLERKTIRNGH